MPYGKAFPVFKLIGELNPPATALVIVETLLAP
jgi:hypothetical protein